jgi:SAM-dependent methyltransferase
MNYANWARWYDTVYATAEGDDVDFYLDLARQSGGPVLEIGVGTGRIAIPGAKSGIEWVGIDLNQPMLDRAVEKAKAAQPLPGGLTLLRQDMRCLELDREFRTVILPSHTLLLATTEEDQFRTLCYAAQHLAPGGTLAFDAFYPDPDMLDDDSPEPIELGEIVDPENHCSYLVTAVNRFDTDAQMNRGTQTVTTLDIDGQEITHVDLDVELRYLHYSEALALIERVGLECVEVYGAFDRSPLDEDSPEMIFVCRWPSWRGNNQLQPSL